MTSRHEIVLMEEVIQLREGLVQLKAENDLLADSLKDRRWQTDQMIYQLEVQKEALRKDAERYRFMRRQGDQVVDVAAIRLVRTTGIMTVIMGEVLDQQIDLLMDDIDD